MEGERLPLVSIITIVYNGDRHIADTMRSVAGQTYPNIEYLLVDGGSTDNTLLIADRFRQHIDILISERDRGISDAFNKGIRAAKGEIIGIINADDFIAKGDHTHLSGEMTINHPTVFVRRECYERFGMFDERYKCAMDYDLLLRLWVRGCRFVRVPGVLANMRWGGTSDAGWKLGCRETLRIKNHYLPARSLSNRLYYYKHITAIRIPRLLFRLGMHSFVRFYRSRLAKVRKEYR